MPFCAIDEIDDLDMQDDRAAKLHMKFLLQCFTGGQARHGAINGMF